MQNYLVAATQPANPFDSGYYESSELRHFGFKSVGEDVKVAKNATLSDWPISHWAAMSVSTAMW